MRAPAAIRRLVRAAVGPLGRVLGCWLCASSALWMFTVSAGVFAYHRAGVDGLAAVSVARLLPALLAAPLAGALSDRLERGRLVAMGNALCAVAYATTGAIALGDGPTGGVVVACALASAAGAAIRPSLESMLPAVCRTPAEVTRATALWGAVDSVGFLLGAGVGGLLLAVLRLGQVVGVAEGLVLLAAALTTSLPRVVATEPDTADEPSGVLAGLRVVRTTRMLHAPLAIFAGLLLLEGTSDVQLVALAMGPLHLGAGGPGLLYAVWGGGGVAASAVLLLVVRRSGYGLALLTGALVFGAAIAVSGLYGVALAVLAMVAAGLGFALVESAALGIVPRLADDAVVGRVYAVLELGYSGGAALGAALAAPLISAFGVAGSLVAVGAGYLALAGATVRRCTALDRGEKRAARVRELLRNVPFLAPLPLPRLERLVRQARAVPVQAGETVIRAGETGQNFFVIDRGSVEVVEYGRTQHDGDGFGEIALLHQVPHTATVRALVDSQLWTVSRATFLAAMDAVAPARLLAEDVVAQHLARPRVS